MDGGATVIGIIRPGQVQLYVRSMGKALKVTAIALNVEYANAHCAKHPDDAVVACIGRDDLVLLANKYDPGITIPKGE
jgi:hypothetical protein